MSIKTNTHQDQDIFSHGVFFALFALFFVAIAFFLSLLYGLSELSVFSLTIILLAVGLRIWSAFSTRSLHYNVSIDKRKVFPGEKIDFQVAIENRKLLPVLVKVRLAIDQFLSPENHELTIREDSGILWHQKIFFHQELRPVKRGLYKTGSPRLITGDFFGFFPRLTREKQEVDILVYPRLIALKPFSVISRIMFGKPAFCSPVCDPVYILGTRDYLHSTSARHIHWKASARHNKLQEKIFEATEQEKLLFILEAEGFIEHEAEQAWERTIEILASLAVEFDTRHYAVGFLTNSAMKVAGPAFLSANRSVNHIPTLLEILAKIDLKSTGPIENLLQQKKYFPPGISCVYFSYRPVEGVLSVLPPKMPLMNLAFREAEQETMAGKKASVPMRSLLLTDLFEAS